MSRYDAYLICQERGHKPSGMVLDSMPPWDVCKFCGTWYRHETQLIEGNIPLPDVPSPSSEANAPHPGGPPKV